MDISWFLSSVYKNDDKVNIFDRVKNRVDIISGVIIRCVVVVWSKLNDIYKCHQLQKKMYRRHSWECIDIESNGS